MVRSNVEFHDEVRRSRPTGKVGRCGSGFCSCWRTMPTGTTSRRPPRRDGHHRLGIKPSRRGSDGSRADRHPGRNGRDAGLRQDLAGSTPGISEERVKPGSRVAALYSGFEAGSLDSMSVNRSRRPPRPAKLCATCNSSALRVPLDTFADRGESIVGNRPRRSRREAGRHVLHRRRFDSRAQDVPPTGFDPVKGYSRKERNLEKFARP